MYADVNFYLESFHGTQEASCEIEASLSLAEIKIDEATFNRIKGRGFENLTEFQQEKSGSPHVTRRIIFTKTDMTARVYRAIACLT